MHRRTLNLGILAHVDAGKTTLTERLLYAAGVIDEVGSVDAGTTQTDSLDLERRRGITIRAAVVSFVVDDVTVNVIDTPGHPDFIAEVERALSVLDGAVLVVSAVEGVQLQTRVLMRALRRLQVPTLVFVNKVDRAGADPDRVREAVSRRLAIAVVPMCSVADPGTRSARVTGAADRAGLIEVLAGRNDALLAAYVEDEAGVTDRRLREELASQTKRALVHPVFFGSAVTAAGVEPLMAGLVELLPLATGDRDGSPAGRIFKIERGRTGEKVCYVRMFAGTVRTRDRLGNGDKVTAISVFDGGTWVRRDEVGAGDIAQLWGLGKAQVGDAFGSVPAAGAGHQFAPPTLETVVEPVHPADARALRSALAQLAEQDPLIDVRQDFAVSLYGEVQKEVIQANLAADYGIDVTFRETTTICVERLAGTGEAVERLHGEGNPFLATVGLRIEPAPPGSGVEFRARVGYRTVPLYVYKNVDSFTESMKRYVRRALRTGLYGWQVTDCVVTLIESNYSSPDGPPATRGPLSTAADFRNLTPLVVQQALERAGTVVCEPTLRVNLEIPVGATGAVLARFGTAVRAQSQHGDVSTIELVVPADRLSDLHRELPGLTGGEGVLESRFDAYNPRTYGSTRGTNGRPAETSW